MFQLLTINLIHLFSYYLTNGCFTFFLKSGYWVHFALMIKKCFNEHNSYFNLNCQEVYIYINLNVSLVKTVKEGREYVHLLLIDCLTGYDLNQNKCLLSTCFVVIFLSYSWEKSKSLCHSHIWESLSDEHL